MDPVVCQDGEYKAVRPEDGPKAIADFLAHITVERHMSAHTLDAYRRDLGALAEWAHKQGEEVEALHAEQIRAFVAAEHRRGLSPKSLQRRLSACRSFYGWLVRQGRLASSPAAVIRSPKAPRKLPQVLDVDEASRLVEVPTDVPLGLRDRALLELFYSSGLRLSELCALRWRDLDLAEGLVTVLGKGQKQRSVPVGSHARAALAARHSDNAVRACEPTGTLRCLRPLPSTLTRLSARSMSRQRNAHNSDRRTPEE